MITELSLYLNEGTNPYKNLALEEYLLGCVRPGQCILYLWQNRHTVVIGRNQNSFKECRIEELERDGGFLARRLSGGGAVFHDLGNLNFTFLVRKPDYDVSRQTEVILRAVQAFGIAASRTGRNDIAIEGRKFSGNAYYESGDFCYHHGTILVDVDKNDMSRYLNVSKEKLQSKSVESVRSRVTNLSEYIPDITVELVKERMELAFAEVYGLPVLRMESGEIDWSSVEEKEKKYSSWEWKYGRKIPFTHCLLRRFPWGEAEITLEVNEGRIIQAVICSDALDTVYLKALEQVLPGTLYRLSDMERVLAETAADTELQREMRDDLAGLIREEL